MKITDVRITPPIGPFEWTLVRVDTDEGLSGYGETPLLSRVHPDDLAQVREAVVGRRPHDAEPILAPLLGAFAPARNIGLVNGVEIALLDLLGKALEVPMYVLLGGKYRNRVRMYQDCHAGQDWSPTLIRDNIRQVAETGRFLDMYTPQAFAEHARQVKAAGFTAMKFDIDFPTPRKLDAHDRSLAPAELCDIITTVAAIREAIGPDTDLAIDLHARYNVADALRIAYEVEPFNLMWLEDPIPPGNHEAMAKVTSKARVPICTGERLRSYEEFRDLITRQAADVVQPDVPHSCGMREMKKIADLADSYLISLGPHNMTSPIGTMAAVHTCAAIPNFLALEFHCAGIPWWDDCVVHEGPIIQQGYIPVPEAPGLGIQLNETVLQQYCQGPLWG